MHMVIRLLVEGQDAEDALANAEDILNDHPKEIT